MELEKINVFWDDGGVASVLGLEGIQAVTDYVEEKAGLKALNRLLSGKSLYSLMGLVESSNGLIRDAFDSDCIRGIDEEGNKNLGILLDGRLSAHVDDSPSDASRKVDGRKNVTVIFNYSDFLENPKKAIEQLGHNIIRTINSQRSEEKSRQIESLAEAVAKIEAKENEYWKWAGEPAGGGHQEEVNKKPFRQSFGSPGIKKLERITRTRA